jgi:predicted unusual protein kinase regulating ubiquinone biosynthesis (AarF/ABC1/UbiB family)
MKLEDNGSFTERMKRYVRVSSAVGGLAAKIVGEKYLGISVNRDAHAEDLTAVLGTLKGPLMKVAQFLATIPGALPPEYASQFLELQTNAPSMGWAFVRRRMAAELGPEWQTKFSDFSKEATAAASLGQVHRARALAGEELACKLQYPDMESILQADMNQLKLVLSIYESFNKALETKDVQDEIFERLHEELDYTHEARNITIYQAIFANSPDIHIPVIYPDLTTKRLLTMSWLEGQSVLSFLSASQEERNILATRLFQAWYYPLYSYGAIHGDPHPGNYTIADNHDLNILDFGCIRIFPPSFIQGVLDLYQALLTNNRDQAVHAYTQWGFSSLNNELIDIITEWAKLLYDPLLDDRMRPIQYELTGHKGWETASKVHAALHKAGGIRPPKEFVFMDRAAVGIGSVMMHLKAEANWYRLFNELTEKFSIDRVKDNQQQFLSI